MNYAEQSFAGRDHHWYKNENPDDLPMEELANIFQAQWYAQIGDLLKNGADPSSRIVPEFTMRS